MKKPLPSLRRSATSVRLSALALLCATPILVRAETVRVQGSGVIAQAVRGAVPVLRTEFGVEVKLFAEVGSTQAIAAIGAETAEVAMSTRQTTAEDRAGFPAKRFEEVQVGTQVVAMVVPRDVWSTGVRAITKEQALGIYQGRIKNWKEVGGDDRAIKFYNVRRGDGIWELFVTWLYTDVRRAPLGNFETVSSAEDARTAVEFNSGAMSLLAPKFVDGKALFALGIKQADGSVVGPDSEAIASRRVPSGTAAFPCRRREAHGRHQEVVRFHGHAARPATGDEGRVRAGQPALNRRLIFRERGRD